MENSGTERWRILMTGQIGYCTKEVLVWRVIVVGKLGGLKSRYEVWSEAFHCSYELGDATKSILSQFIRHLSADTRGRHFHFHDALTVCGIEKYLWGRLIFQDHLRTAGGKFWEFVFSLRFFFFQYGVSYHLNVFEGSTSILVCISVDEYFSGFTFIFLKYFTFTNKSFKKCRKPWHFWFLTHPEIEYKVWFRRGMADVAVGIHVTGNSYIIIFANMDFFFWDIVWITGVCLLLANADWFCANFQGMILFYYEMSWE